MYAAISVSFDMSFISVNTDLHPSSHSCDNTFM